MLISSRSLSDTDLLVFELGGVRCALPAADVSEVVRAVTIAPLPRAPEIVEGLINVRGTLVPVLDVRRRFRLAPRGVSPADHLILARAGSRLVAIRVDRALDVIRVAAADVQEADALVPGAAWVAGVVRLPDGLLVIHDLHTFLSESEGASLDDAAAGMSGETR